MNISKSFFLATVIFAISIISGVLIINEPPAAFLTSVHFLEQKEITRILEQYFDIRYHSFGTLKLGDLSTVVANSSEGNAFLQQEQDKLEIQLYHAAQKHLRYLECEYFLDVTDILIDKEMQTATVSVIEGYDVVFEISQPVVSSMRNTEHTITMRKESGEWRIVNDEYDDYLWRLIRSTGQSKEEIIYLIDESQNATLDREIEPAMDDALPLSSDKHYYPYNRNGAVDYAREWALDRNTPKYFDFEPPLYNGDCTNFVSQAIHEGGGAFMAHLDYDCGNDCIGTAGWYYTDINHRAAAWVYVDNIYTFTTTTYEKWYWDYGPEGREIDLPNIELGDIVQYQWDDADDEWDHSAIVVGFTIYEHVRYPLIASHDDDLINHPHYIIDYYRDRFIHIERLKTPHGIFLPLVMKYDGNTRDEHLEPYPAPVQESKLSPYPPPSP